MSSVLAPHGSNTALYDYGTTRYILYGSGAGPPGFCTAQHKQVGLYVLKNEPFIIVLTSSRLFYKVDDRRGS